MKQLLTAVSDILFPPTPEVLELRGLPHTALVQYFSPQSNNEITSLTRYDIPLVQIAIRANKFQHYRPARVMLARVLDIWLVQQKTPIYFVPIPLGPARERARGYNQVSFVISNCLLPYTLIRALKRKRETEPQTNLSKYERQHNVHGAFSITSQVGRIPSGAHVVLVDDVSSTGATLKAARAELAPHLPANCTLTCLALAH